MSEPKDDVVKAGLVGCGRIGSQTSESLRHRLPRGWLPLSHAEAICATDGVELDAICDIDQMRVDWAGDKYAVKQRFSVVNEFLQSGLDMVSVATRTPGRSELVVAAAEAGIRAMHVEKPLARSLRECDLALNAATKYGMHLTYGTTRRWMDIYHLARDMVNAGEIGELEQIVMEHGPAMLLWAHPHASDLLLFFAGSDSIESVQGRCRVGNVSADRLVVDDDPIVETILVEFNNGISGLISSIRGMTVRLGGSKGSLAVLADGSGIELRRNRGGAGPYHLDSQYLSSQADISGTQAAITECVAAVNGKFPQPKITHREIRDGLLILLAGVWSSLEGGRPVTPGELPSDFQVTGRFGDAYA